MAAYYRYISDNPYRLLTLPSATSLRVLRQKATATAQAQKVGLPTPVSLHSTFGDTEIDHCADTVKTLVGNATTRCLHRQLWPYYLPPQSPLVEYPDDLEGLLVSDPSRLDFHAQQCKFLMAYFSFLTTASPSALSSSLSSWASLYADAEHEAYLRDLLESEGEEATDAYNAVVDAQNTLAECIVRQAVETALKTLHHRDEAEFQSLVSIIRKANLDIVMVDRVFADILVAAGERERELIQGRIAQTRNALQQQAWSPNWAPFDLDEINRLSVFATALEGCHPSTVLWQQTVTARVDQIGAAMNAYAITLFNSSGDASGATTVLRQTQRLPTSAELRTEIDLNLDVIERSETNIASLQVAPNGLGSKSQGSASVDRLRPVTNPPWMFTLNGFGTRLYGGGRYAENPLWHYATLYIVFLFIPMVPLKRYLVSDAPRGWHFHATAPFTRWHKAHLAISLALLLWVVFAINQAPTTPAATTSGAAAPSPNTSGINTSTANMGSPPSRMASDAQDEQRKTRLLDEAERLQQTLTTEGPTLNSDGASLDRDRADIQSQQDVLRGQKKRIKAERITLNSTDAIALASFNHTIDTFNHSKQAFGDKIQRFNAHVTAHNRHLAHLKAVKQRLDQIRRALGE